MPCQPRWIGPAASPGPPLGWFDGCRAAARIGAICAVRFTHMQLHARTVKNLGVPVAGCQRLPDGPAHCARQGRSFDWLKLSDSGRSLPTPMAAAGGRGADAPQLRAARRSAPGRRSGNRNRLAGNPRQSRGKPAVASPVGIRAVQHTVGAVGHEPRHCAQGQRPLLRLRPAVAARQCRTSAGRLRPEPPAAASLVPSHTSLADAITTAGE